MIIVKIWFPYFLKLAIYLLYVIVLIKPELLYDINGDTKTEIF